MFAALGNSSPTPRNTTATGEGQSSDILGNGLVEISALTTLIGSNTVEQLTLGNRGAAGTNNK